MAERVFTGVLYLLPLLLLSACSGGGSGGSGSGNQTPVAIAQVLTQLEGAPLSITLSGSDADGDSLTYQVVTQPTHGALTGTVPNLTYTPAANFYGFDSFTFRVNDGTVDSALATVSITIYAITPLNDTGIIVGANYPDGKNLDCTLGETIAEQDCSHGRDFTNNDNSDGHAGFSFTKLDASGNDLVAASPTWSCVRDEITGLIWEVKQGGDTIAGNEGLHDADDVYTWYNSDPNTNGGSAGVTGLVTSCHGYNASDSATDCNTEAYVARVNSAGLCGATDWRMPTVAELVSIVNFNRTDAAVDIAYFPNIPATPNSYYWTATPHAFDSGAAWNIYFYDGYAFHSSRDNSRQVRLVRYVP